MDGFELITFPAHHFGPMQLQRRKSALRWRARVMLCDVDQERGDAVAADIRNAGGET